MRIIRNSHMVAPLLPPLSSTSSGHVIVTSINATFWRQNLTLYLLKAFVLFHTWRHIRRRAAFIYLYCTEKNN